MTHLVNRAKYVLNGEEGASMMEIIVWFTVVLAVGAALLLLKDTVVDFLNSIVTKIGTFKTEADTI